MRTGRCLQSGSASSPPCMAALSLRGVPHAHLTHQMLQSPLVLEAADLLSLRKERQASKERLNTSLSLKKFKVMFYICSARSGFVGVCRTHHEIIYSWVTRAIIFQRKHFQLSTLKCQFIRVVGVGSGLEARIRILVTLLLGGEMSC